MLEVNPLDLKKTAATLACDVLGVGSGVGGLSGSTTYSIKSQGK